MKTGSGTCAGNGDSRQSLEQRSSVYTGHMLPREKVDAGTLPQKSGRGGDAVSLRGTFGALAVYD